MPRSFRRFRPTLWPTVFTIPVLAVLVALGSWQVHRLAWKTELIANFEARVAEAPVAAPDRIDDIDAWRYRRVLLSGRFLNDKELHVTGKTYEGNAGFHVITPLVTDGGLTFLVNRGWVPEARRRPDARPETVTDGPVEVVGMVRDDLLRGYFVPDNDPAKEVWLYVDTGQMAAHRGLGPVAGYYVDAIRPPGPFQLPIGATTTVTVRNEHLSYAVIWFSFALTLAAIYFIYHWRREEAE